MRPLRIEVSGLRSFRGTQSIDFSELGLFAVVGDTGAGKSSILEAMIYALYNATSWSERDVRSLIALDGDTMKVVFDFQAGGSVYRVTRSTSRAAGRPPLHALRSLSDPAYRVDGETAVNDEIERIVGLDYATFRKTVVLPQGRFAELLLAKDSERQRILGDLLGLDGVDRLREALEPARDEARALRDRLDGARAELGDDLPGRLQAARDGAAAAVASVEAFGVTAAELGELLPRRRRMVESESAAARVGEALALVDRPIAALRALRGHDERLAAALASANERRAASQDAARATADAVRELREHGRDLATVTRHEEIFRRVRDDRTSLSDEAAEFAALTDRLGAARRSLDEAIAARPDMLRKADDAESALRTATAAHAAIQAEYRNAAGAWARLESARTAARDTASRVAGLVERELEALAARDPAQQAVQDATEQAREAQRAVEDARSANAVAAVAHGLHAGDPCPICARTLPKTFTPPSNAQLDPLLTAAKHADRARDRATQRLASVAATADLATDALAEARASGEECARGLVAAEAAVRALGLDPSAPDEAAATGALQHRESDLHEAVLRASADRDVARGAADRAGSSIDAQERAYSERRAEQTAAARRIAERRRRWEAARMSLPDSFRPAADAADEAYAALAPVLEQATGHARHSEENAHAALVADQEAERAVHDAEMRHRREVVDPELAECNRLENALARIGAADVDRILAAPPVRSGAGLPNSVAWADALFDWSADVSALLADRAGAFKRERTELERSVAALLARHGVASPEAFDVARGKAQTAAGGAQTRLEAAEEAVQRAAQLDAQRDELAPLEHVLGVLSTYLQARAFKEWLMRRRELTLLGVATEILRKMTRGRYAFAARFRIIDGNSGLERSPQTLSGGETFLGSLALALAVVEVASRTGGKIEAMFLDEGFGSLDAAALDEALSELAERASGGHLIGVVTHVRGVAEIIETILRVRRFAGGSVVERLDAAERAAYLEDELAAGLLPPADDSGSAA